MSERKRLAQLLDALADQFETGARWIDDEIEVMHAAADQLRADEARLGPAESANSEHLSPELIHDLQRAIAAEIARRFVSKVVEQLPSN